MGKGAMKNLRKAFLRDLLFLGAVVLITAVLLSMFPEKKDPVFLASKNFLVEMLLIMPAVMVLMGLFAVFVPDELIVRYLGKSSGLRGMLIAILIGAFPTGPLYVAFPIAASLLKKGARVASVVAFLSAWACIKIPQELVELQFLGLRFMAARLALTIVFVLAMGLLMERILGRELRDVPGVPEPGRP
ncbi:permease [Thermococcus nautili]|nr:permease [Thermococcus nautili]